MSEGVLALDSEENIVAVNRAAATLLDIAPESAVGQSVFEIVRIPALHNLLWDVEAQTTVAEAEFVISGEEDRYIQAHATALIEESGASLGTVVVLNDVTRLRSLENLRSEFVANVSHELKTPITAITGAVETLQAGAIDDPSDSRRFLDMVQRHSARLRALVDDLLFLARLEKRPEPEEAPLTRYRLAETLEAAVDACRLIAHNRGITISCDCPRDFEAPFDPPLIDQAVTNLLTNAIKASPADSTIEVSAQLQDDQLVIAVADHGCGITARHLPRLFERFYRVDDARSREAGGTGLGLAIVKHVALTHGGRVDVESTVGKGSVFRIFLPVKD
jgi:two-component system phosphate regulon sensor histidine kinase PhoR